MGDPNPLITLQDWVTAKLNSEDYFAGITVKSLRRMHLDQETAAAMPHLLTKNGKSGIGVLVMMPRIEAPPGEVNVPGPQLDLAMDIEVIEQPTMNLNAATGTGVTAEDVGLEIMGLLHLWQAGFITNL